MQLLSFRISPWSMQARGLVPVLCCGWWFAAVRALPRLHPGHSSHTGACTSGLPRYFPIGSPWDAVTRGRGVVWCGSGPLPVDLVHLFPFVSFEFGGACPLCGVAMLVRGLGGSRFPLPPCHALQHCCCAPDVQAYCPCILGCSFFLLPLGCGGDSLPWPELLEGLVGQNGSLREIQCTGGGLRHDTGPIHQHQVGSSL